MWTAEEIKRLISATERIAKAMEEQTALLKAEQERNKEKDN